MQVIVLTCAVTPVFNRSKFQLMQCKNLPKKSKLDRVN